MNKNKWEELAKQIKGTEITTFELGVIAGLSSKYDFSEYVKPPRDTSPDTTGPAKKTA